MVHTSGSCTLIAQRNLHIQSIKGPDRHFADIRAIDRNFVREGPFQRRGYKTRNEFYSGSSNPASPEANIDVFKRSMYLKWGCQDEKLRFFSFWSNIEIDPLCPEINRAFTTNSEPVGIDKKGICLPQPVNRRPSAYRTIKRGRVLFCIGYITIDFSIRTGLPRPLVARVLIAATYQQPKDSTTEYCPDLKDRQKHGCCLQYYRFLQLKRLQCR